jgi:hypothetical protein
MPRFAMEALSLDERVIDFGGSIRKKAVMGAAMAPVERTTITTAIAAERNCCSA